MSRRRGSSSTGWTSDDSRYGDPSVEELEATVKYHQAKVDQMVKEGKNPRSPIDYIHIVDSFKEQLTEAKKKKAKGGRRLSRKNRASRKKLLTRRGGRTRRRL
uniref:Uncharacterized protein n=1 Tax=viral metagenome TaxID=1070528 RepID=A0A6C0AJ47_9ZZZZ